MTDETIALCINLLQCVLDPGCIQPSKPPYKAQVNPHCYHARLGVIAEMVGASQIAIRNRAAVDEHIRVEGFLVGQRLSMRISSGQLGGKALWARRILQHHVHAK